MLPKPKHTQNLNFFELFIVVCFWLILFGAPLLFGQFDKTIAWEHVFRVWRDHLILFPLFLLNRFVLLPKLFFLNKRTLYVVSVSLSIFLIVIGTYTFQSKYRNVLERPLSLEHILKVPNPAYRPFPPPRDAQPNPPLQSTRKPVPLFLNILALSVLIVAFDTGVRVSFKWVETDQRRVKLEKENAENQLALLRNQVSPHFFMNTLNNIHSLVDINTEEAKESIIKLSKMMRYLLYETETEQTTLKRELEFLQSYIDLMRLRYSEKVAITLNLPSGIPDKTLPPFLFTSIIENAFKHGVSYKDESIINIEMIIGIDRLLFTVKNSKAGTLECKEFSGIGIENLRKRLNLLYANNYHLDIIDSEKLFTINLSIPL